MGRNIRLLLKVNCRRYVSVNKSIVASLVYIIARSINVQGSTEKGSFEMVTE